jgi:hypothetical protein
MGRPCSICKHPEAAHIAQALAEDASVRKLAARFGLTKSAINRHINKCLTPAVQNVIRESGKLMKDAKTAAPVPAPNARLEPKNPGDLAGRRALGRRANGFIGDLPKREKIWSCVLD